MNAEILGSLIAANVTILLAAFAVVRKAIASNPQPKVMVTQECLSRIVLFMDSTEKVLVEASKIQHTHSRYMNDVRVELTNLRSEISEMKGRMR